MCHARTGILLLLAAFIPPAFAIGEGSFYSLPNKLKPKAVAQNQLIGETLINKQVRVKGKAGATIVNGVVAINNTAVRAQNTAALIEVECPTHGNTVIINNASVINHGVIQSISNSGSAKAAPIVVNCHRKLRPKVIVNNVTIKNDGLIQSIGK